MFFRVVWGEVSGLEVDLVCGWFFGRFFVSCGKSLEFRGRVEYIYVVFFKLCFKIILIYDL